MFVQRVLTLYPLASGETPRPGTCGLRFNAAGPAVFNVGKTGSTGALVAGDAVSLTAVAAEALETGPLFSVTTLPAGTLGVVLR